METQIVCRETRRPAAHKEAQGSAQYIRKTLGTQMKTGEVLQAAPI